MDNYIQWATSISSFFSFFLLSWGINHLYEKKCRERRLLGIGWLHTLRVLLTHIQQHRSLTTSYLAGDGAPDQVIRKLQMRISHDVIEINRLGKWINESSHFDRITEHWKCLAAQYESAEIHNNMDQHNRLVGNILQLIDETAVHHGLIQEKVLEEKEADIIWKKLLLISEYAGQARSLGTGIAAAGECDRVSRIRLGYLREKIMTATKEVWEQLSVIDDEKKKLEKLIHCIDTQLLSNRPTVTPARYFNTATEFLSTIFNQFDRQLALLRKRG